MLIAGHLWNEAEVRTLYKRPAQLEEEDKGPIIEGPVDLLNMWAAYAVHEEQQESNDNQKGT